MPRFECRTCNYVRYFTEPYDVAIWLVNTKKPLTVECTDVSIILKWQYVSKDELKEYGLKYDTPVWIKIYDESNDTKDAIMTEHDFCNLFV